MDLKVLLFILPHLWNTMTTYNQFLIFSDIGHSVLLTIREFSYFHSNHVLISTHQVDRTKLTFYVWEVFTYYNNLVHYQRFLCYGSAYSVYCGSVGNIFCNNRIQASYFYFHALSLFVYLRLLTCLLFFWCGKTTTWCK